MLKKIIRAVNWIRQELGRRGLLGIAFLIYAVIPDYAGRNQWWLSAWTEIKPILFTYNRPVLIVVGLFLIWLDCRRILGKTKPKPHDLTTLQGRILQLRDELKEFGNQIEQKWPHSPKDNPGVVDPIANQKRMEAVLLRSQALMHGFILKFHDRAKLIYHEAAYAGTDNTMFGQRLDAPIVTGAQLDELISDLDWLSKHVD